MNSKNKLCGTKIIVNWMNLERFFRTSIKVQIVHLTSFTQDKSVMHWGQEKFQETFFWRTFLSFEKYDLSDWNVLLASFAMSFMMYCTYWRGPTFLRVGFSNLYKCSGCEEEKTKQRRIEEMMYKFYVEGCHLRPHFFCNHVVLLFWNIPVVPH